MGAATATDNGVWGEIMNTKPPASFMMPSTRINDLNGDAVCVDIVPE